MSAEEIRNIIKENRQRIIEGYGHGYFAGWSAALEWMAQKEEGEQK